MLVAAASTSGNRSDNTIDGSASNSDGSLVVALCVHWYL